MQDRILRSGIHAAKIIRAVSTGIVLLSVIVSGYSQPAPGEVFREFTFIPEDGHFGELDPECKREFTEEQWIHKPRMVMKSPDMALDHAEKAEMIIEFWGGHIGTSQQKFRINQNDWMDLPQPQNTPTNPLCYHRTLLGNTSVKVPLEHLKNGKNMVQFTCGPQVCYNFNFGFYWIYSFSIRVYYDPSVQHTEGFISSPREGNNVFRQWHYQSRYGEKYKHMGSVSRKPFRVTWNTRWLPDQEQALKMAAIITDQNGISYMTPEVTGIWFHRRMYPKHLPCG